MKKLTEKIYKELLSRNSVLLMGRADSGKTYYALNELIPFLNNKKLNTAYFANCDNLLIIPDNIDVVIVDEVEILIDKDFLERQHPKDKPYYSSEYLEKVKSWHNKLKLIQKPAVFILTRSGKEEIEYLIDNVKTTDWEVSVKCLVFENYKKYTLATIIGIVPFAFIFAYLGTLPVSYQLFSIPAGILLISIVYISGGKRFYR